MPALIQVVQFAAGSFAEALPCAVGTTSSTGSFQPSRESLRGRAVAPTTMEEAMLFLRKPVLVLTLLLGWSGAGSAQQTGSVSGAVFDQTGNPLPDVIVRIVGDLLPAGRTATTSETGQYAFTLLPPGT